jgi:hypothetical protein
MKITLRNKIIKKFSSEKPQEENEELDENQDADEINYDDNDEEEDKRSLITIFFAIFICTPITSAS